jgi:hypothetical protein
LIGGLAVAGAALPLLSRSQPPEPGEPLVTIKELMEKTITPATNRLWSVPETPTDEDWAALEEAAITLLAAAHVNSLGGTGPKDNEWVTQPAYQAFNQAMIAAGRQALAAVRERKTDALLAAGDVLYPPCEGCHLQFNPAVVETRRPASLGPNVSMSLPSIGSTAASFRPQWWCTGTGRSVNGARGSRTTRCPIMPASA